ncbi:hypothetical protein E2C01_009115 [Portunus trituberculatus]|uniref:Uncharacterized protein n=1 Tax=Portunus trituberculatus TaxID=210409 RepID=A0A5B7D5P6_PORTR|nr:hypothetical protein [Portunus trituberculatus]
MDFVGARLDNLCELLPSPGQSSTSRTSSHTLQSPPSKHCEAFPGQPDPPPQAPSLPGYVSYAHMVRNGLLSYIHSSLTHRLLRSSTDPYYTI